MASEQVERFLRARGCPEEVVAGGLEALVADWERTVKQVDRGYPLGLDDYLNDIDARQLMEELVAAMPEVATDSMLERIEAADVVMQAAVSQVDECLWGDAIADREGWTPEDNWWYFGLPRNPGPQMREELDEL